MQHMKVGIVGFGRMGQAHAKVWSEIPGVTLRAVVDPVHALRQKAIETYGCGTFIDIYQLFSSINLDILVIATHAPHHVGQVLIALTNGCHVMCEKPMALRVKSCDIMVETAERAGLKLAINHQSYFSRAREVIEQQITEGVIGNLYLMRAYGKGRLACSDLMEIAGHLLHLVRHFAKGDVYEVFGNVTTNGQDITHANITDIQSLYPEGRDSGIGAGDTMFGYYKFTSGVRGELQLAQVEGAPTTVGENRSFGYYIDFFGTKGRLQLYLPRVLFYNASPYDDFSKNKTPWVEVDPSLRADTEHILIKRNCEDFLDAIEKNREPMVSGNDGRTVMEMSLGIYASHFAGRPLSIPLSQEWRENHF